MKLLICTQAVDQNHPILGFFIGWIEEFAKHFEEVHVICLQKGFYELPQNVFVYSLGKEEGENKLVQLLKFYRYFSHVFFKVKVDFVFFHMGAIYNILAAPFFLVRKLYKTSFYWWKTHGTINTLGKIALLFVDRVYTASAKSFHVNTAKKHVVGHAVETATQMPRTKTENNTPVVLFVGRVTPVKKIEVLIEAIALFTTKGMHCAVRIVGLTPDALYEKKLRDLIATQHLENEITFVGPLKHNELDIEFKHADIVVNPSETGGIDKVVLEAMSHGVPVVALDDTYGELLAPFGLSISKQDPNLYVEKIEYILMHKESAKDMSSRLQKVVTEGHSLSTITKRIFNI